MGNVGGVELTKGEWRRGRWVKRDGKAIMTEALNTVPTDVTDRTPEGPKANEGKKSVLELICNST